MSGRLNAEIKFRWLRLGLRAHWTERVDDALKFVTEQGRMKFVRPIYRSVVDAVTICSLYLVLKERGELQ